MRPDFPLTSNLPRGLLLILGLLILVALIIKITNWRDRHRDDSAAAHTALIKVSMALSLVLMSYLQMVAPDKPTAKRSQTPSHLKSPETQPGQRLPPWQLLGVAHWAALRRRSISFSPTIGPAFG